MCPPEFISTGGEWAVKLHALNSVLESGTKHDNFWNTFERGVAVAEELDLVYAYVDAPLNPAPTPETQALRSAVASALVGSSLLQKLELGQILTTEFERIRQDINSTVSNDEPETIGGSLLLYNEYAQLREVIGISTLHAWSHAWNRARALGLLNEQGELPLDRLEKKLARWSSFRPLGVGKATLRVYTAVLERTRKP